MIFALGKKKKLQHTVILHTSGALRHTTLAHAHISSQNFARKGLRTAVGCNVTGRQPTRRLRLPHPPHNDGTKAAGTSLVPTVYVPHRRRSHAFQHSTTDQPRLRTQRILTTPRKTASHRTRRSRRPRVQGLRWPPLPQLDSLRTCRALALPTPSTDTPRNGESGGVAQPLAHFA